MASRNARKKKLRKKRISAILTTVSFAVLIGCILYLWNEIAMYNRSTQVADSVRDTYYNTASAETVNKPTAVAEPTEAPAAAQTDEPTAAPAAPTEAPVVQFALETEAPTAVPTEAPTAVPTAVPTEVPTAAPTKVPEPVMQEKFVDLYEQNDDLIGWIKVNDKIDYPMLWLEGDNDFYMTHDFDGNKSEAGWIFLDKRDQPDMSDDHLLIYGHNMRNGSMFGLLDEYRYLDHIRKNPIIEIQSAWESEPRKYVLISLFDASMNKDNSSYIKITHFNFDDPEEKQEFIDKLKKRSMYKLPCDANADDQLVTLITCEYSHPNGRFLFICRELREDETEEQIRELYAKIK